MTGCNRLILLMGIAQCNGDCLITFLEPRYRIRLILTALRKGRELLLEVEICLLLDSCVNLHASQFLLKRLNG